MSSLNYGEEEELQVFWGPLGQNLVTRRNVKPYWWIEILNKKKCSLYKIKTRWKWLRNFNFRFSFVNLELAAPHRNKNSKLRVGILLLYQQNKQFHILLNFFFYLFLFRTAYCSLSFSLFLTSNLEQQQQQLHYTIICSSLLSIFMVCFLKEQGPSSSSWQYFRVHVALAPVVSRLPISNLNSLRHT